MQSLIHRLTISSTILAVSSITVFAWINHQPINAQYSSTQNLLEVPSRKQMLDRLQRNDFDLLIIGGGATGTGCALDATTRGLKVALVERDDFSSGTSSRSTKLVHGGVRYLEKAFLNFDIEQYKLVKEALHERGIFLKIAPHLTYELPTMLPIYQLWKVPYYYIGSKVYDILAGVQGLTPSYFMFPKKAKKVFPMVRNSNLYGAMVYYDGAQNDSRMNVALAMTAALHGAVVVNHCEVTKLVKVKNAAGKTSITGAIVRDTFTGSTWQISAKGVINATGPFTDSIRKMDDPSVESIVAPSSGVHLILPDYFCPSNLGLIDPATSDGRVIFVLPWEGSTIAGTTDEPTELSYNPQTSSAEVDWILKEVNKLMNDDIQVRKQDVLAAWTGIRPLVRDPNAHATEGLVRNHMINISDSGLLTIAGGKWTTYRSMSEETIDKSIQEFKHTLLVGAEKWKPSSFISLIQKYGLDSKTAKHLSCAYGDQAYKVAELSKNHQFLSKNHQFVESEVVYACRREFACTAVDVLARRTRLAFLHAKDAFQALPNVIRIMSDEHGWDEKRRINEYKEGYEFLLTMGLELK